MVGSGGVMLGRVWFGEVWQGKVRTMFKNCVPDKNHHFMIETPNGIDRLPYPMGTCKYCGFEKEHSNLPPEGHTRRRKLKNGKEIQLNDITFSRKGTPFRRK